MASNVGDIGRRAGAAVLVLSALILSASACGSTARPPGQHPGVASSPSERPGAGHSSDAASGASPSAGPGSGSAAPRSDSGAPRNDSAPWTENFDGAAGTAPDSSLLQPLTGDDGAGNHELEAYTASPTNFALDGHGHLVITARRQTVTGVDGVTRNWTSARLTSKGLWTFRYGTLSARIRSSVGNGLWPAFWLLGSDIDTVGWPAAGEIDILEALDSGRIAYHSLHGPTDTGAAWGMNLGTRRSAAAAVAYHVYTVQRRPRQITFSIDGAVVARITPASLSSGRRWVFDTPMFVLLNLAVGGDWPQQPDSSTPATARMTVDWLKFSP